MQKKKKKQHPPLQLPPTLLFPAQLKPQSELWSPLSDRAVGATGGPGIAQAGGSIYFFFNQLTPDIISIHKQPR